MTSHLAEWSSVSDSIQMWKRSSLSCIALFEAFFVCPPILFLLLYLSLLVPLIVNPILMLLVFQTHVCEMAWCLQHVLTEWWTTLPPPPPLLLSLVRSELAQVYLTSHKPSLFPFNSKSHPHIHPSSERVYTKAKNPLDLPEEQRRVSHIIWVYTDKFIWRDGMSSMEQHWYFWYFYALTQFSIPLKIMQRMR